MPKFRGVDNPIFDIIILPKDYMVEKSFLDQYKKGLSEASKDPQDEGRSLVILEKLKAISAQVKPREPVLEFEDTFVENIIPVYTKYFDPWLARDEVSQKLKVLFEGPEDKKAEHFLRILEAHRGKFRQEYASILLLHRITSTVEDRLKQLQGALSKRKNELQIVQNELEQVAEAMNYIAEAIALFSYTEDSTDMFKWAFETIKSQINNNKVLIFYNLIAHFIIDNKKFIKIFKQGAGKTKVIHRFIVPREDRKAKLESEIVEINKEISTLNEVLIPSINLFKEIDSIFAEKIAYQTSVLEKYKPVSATTTQISSTTPLTVADLNRPLPPGNEAPNISRPKVRPVSDPIKPHTSKSSKDTIDNSNLGRSIKLLTEYVNKSIKSKTYVYIVVPDTSGGKMRKDMERKWCDLLTHMGLKEEFIKYVEYGNIKNARGFVIMPARMNTHQNFWEKPTNGELIIIDECRPQILLNEIKFREKESDAQQSSAKKAG